MRDMTMRPNVPPRIATSEADPPGSMRSNRLETDMDKTKKRLMRAKRHAVRLSQYALAGAGGRRAVARALGRNESTVSHQCTSRASPELLEFFTALLTDDRAAVSGGRTFRVFCEAFGLWMRLMGSDAVSGRAFAEACLEAVELREIVMADDEVLLERGLYLLEQEDVVDSLEDIATKRSTKSHAASLRTHASVAAELATIEDELLARHVDLLAVYRERARRAA